MSLRIESTDVGNLSTRIAAATPFHRQDALAQAAEALHRRRPQSADDLSQLADIRALSGGCESGLWTLAHYGEFEGALDVARGCDAEAARRIAAGALYATGRFEEASLELDQYSPKQDDEHWMSSSFETRVHLLGGRNDRAIESAKLRASQLRRISENYRTADLNHIDGAEDRSSARDITMDRLLRWAEIFDCVVDALDARGGDLSAERSLRSRAVVTEVCGLLAADLVTGDGETISERERWQQNYSRPNRISELLLLEVQPDRQNFPRTLLDTIDGRRLHGLHRFLQQTSPAIERAALAVLDDVSSPARAVQLNRAELRIRTAVLEYLSGDHEAARREVERARGFLESGEGRRRNIVSMRPRPRRMDSAKALATLIEIDAGQTRRAREIFSTIPSYSRHRFERLEFLLLFAERGLRAGVVLPGNVMAQRAVVSGDGEEIAALLGQNSALWQTARLWTHRVRSNRATLTNHLRWSDESRCRECTLAQLLVDASNRRSAALNLRDERWASTLNGPIERIREAMSRRDIAVPLWVLEHIED